jgi:RHS repeat-associated protein
LLSLLGFNGERPDPVTGHYLLGNGYRAFNPVLLRFNSPDSWSPFGEGGLNSYAYCLGDPINRYDPDGHTTMTMAMRATVKLVQWRGHARAKIAARADAANEIAKTNTIKIPMGTYSLKPGVTPKQAVDALEQTNQFLFLGSKIPTYNAKYHFDLSSTRRRAAFLQKTVGTPANQNGRLKLLEYIKEYDPKSRQAFSFEKLHGAIAKDFDLNVQEHNRPSSEEAGKYLRELFVLENPMRSEFHLESERIFDLNFIRKTS